MAFSRDLKRPRGRPRINFAQRERREKRVLANVADATRGKLGQQLYELRVSMGMTRCELAELMSVSSTAIYLWEHGRLEPSKVVWASFLRVRNSYRRKVKRFGKDLDGGPLMEDTWSR